MSIKHMLTTLLVACFILSAYGFCLGQDQKPRFVVKQILITPAEHGKEKVTLRCSQVCDPALSALEGDRPRIIMDLKGVISRENKNHKGRQSGKLVKNIRSYLDQKSGRLRIVLDMDPSKNYLASPISDQPVNAFSLLISVQPSAKRGRSGKAIGVKRGRILMTGQMQNDHAATPRMIKKFESRAGANLEEKEWTVAQGRSLMDAGDYDGAIVLFTRIIEKNPKNSLCYRLRGNAYSNIGDRPKAIHDWTAAARLGDQTIQSYLDFLKVPWRGKSKS